VFICNITHFMWSTTCCMKHIACLCGDIILICKISCLCEVQHACVYHIVFTKTCQITENFDLRPYSVDYDTL
jgi:hypothetical protein